MQSEPKISVILPTYNRANLIVETVESVRTQTYSNWEIIIIDDGSEDNTEHLIKDLDDKRIVFIKAGRIGINGRIKNIGLERATGQMIAFIDSDDLWAYDKLEKQMHAMAQYPDAGFCLTGGYDFRKLGEPISFFYKQKEGIKYGNIFPAFFQSEAASVIPTLLLKKDCIVQTGRFDESKPFADVEFILSLANHYPGIILYEPLFYRRLHEASTSEKDWKAGYADGLALILKYRNSLQPKLARNALFRLHMNYGEDCILHHMKFLAIKNFLSAWKNKPFSIVPIKKIGKAILRT